MTSEDLDPAPETSSPRGLGRFSLLRTGPTRLGFFATVGVLLALLLGGAVVQLASVLTLIFLALFISMGLYPVVTALQRRKVPKPLAILIVIAAFGVVIAVMLLMIVPVVVGQGGELLRSLPANLSDIENQGWFLDLNSQFNGYPSMLLEWVRTAAADPNTWAVIGGGALGIVRGVINGTFSLLFVIAITLYFVASLDIMKQALYDLVPGSKTRGFKEITEEIVESIGKYLGGQVILAAIIAVFSFLLMTVMGLPYGAIIAFLALFLSLIPVIGSVIVTVLMTFMALFTSPLSALIVAVVMIAYMQIEAYVFGPRIISKAVHIPASLVLIGAVAGAALGGLLGALVAAPVTASILLVIKKVVVPRQRLL